MNPNGARKSTARRSGFAGRWQLDPDRTSIEFHTKAFWVLPVKGTFRALGGAGTASADGGLSGTLVVDANSVDTGITRRDTHLRAADFLGVEEFPTITYEVTGGRPTGSGAVDLDGTLTVRGTSRPLAVSAWYRVGRDSVTVWTEIGIDRSDWGLSSRPFGAGLENRVFVTARFDKV